jgi:ubiquinone/menaquinone biosynthesis C-methylase UbiE
LYGLSARYYDLIYNWKDYERESEKIHRLIQKHKKTRGRDLLDVACGTGNHIAYLRKLYHVEGLDINPYMLSQARKKFPDVKFSKGDMRNFRLKRQFDVVTCLFSAIGHLKNGRQLVQAFRTIATHLKPGGIYVLEPSFSPDKWDGRRIGANFVNQSRLKIARMNISERKGSTAILNMHHLVASPKGIEYFVEHMEMQLFKQEEYHNAFNRANLRIVVYDKNGLEGRGLYLATKPVE